MFWDRTWVLSWRSFLLIPPHYIKIWIRIRRGRLILDIFPCWPAHLSSHKLRNFPKSVVQNGSINNYCFMSYSRKKSLNVTVGIAFYSSIHKKLLISTLKAHHFGIQNRREKLGTTFGRVGSLDWLNFIKK